MLGKTHLFAALGIGGLLASSSVSQAFLEQHAYVKASNTDLFDGFGYNVAVSGDTLVVAAPSEDSSATGVDGDQSSDAFGGAGAAYVFVRNGTTWTQQAYLKASNTHTNNGFGSSVAIDGDTIVVGATSESSSSKGVDGDETQDHAPNAGAAYVFVRSGTSWSQQAYLKATNTQAGDVFGRSVSVSGDTIVVGAYGEDSRATGVNGNQTNNVAESAGAAYVFVRQGTSWSPQAYLKASNTEPFDNFGWSVSVSGDTIAVAAPGEDSGASGVGGDEDDNSIPTSGAVYVFVRSGTAWSQQAYVKASNPGNHDAYGDSISISGDTLLVGASAESSGAIGVNGNQNDESAADSGAAYVFVRSDTMWTQQAYLKASNTGIEDHFGSTVSVSGDVVVVGAHSEDSGAIGIDGNQSLNGAPSAGAAYVFARSAGSWAQQAYFKGSNTTSGDEFGGSVAVSGLSVVAGATGEDSSATGVDGDQFDNLAQDSGAVFMFDLGAWTKLGFALEGAGGAPALSASGTLTPGSSNQLALTKAKGSAAAVLIFGLSQIDAPLKGGVLVPAPQILVPIGTSPAGTIKLPFPWPSGVPAGVALYFQFWIADPSGPAGLAASNGLKGVSG